MSKLLKSKKVIAIVMATSLVAVPVVARPVMQKVQAYLNPSIEYVLDGEEILEGTTTVNYKDKNYVSVAELSKALGKEITIQGNKVILTTPNTESQPETSDKTGKVTIQKAIIKEIDTKNNQVTILADGKGNSVYNYLTLNVTETGESETLIRHELNKARYVLEDLKEGMAVKVVHSSMQTYSIPPQTPAYEIVILSGENTQKPVPPTENSTESSYEIDDAIIKEINYSQKYVIVKAEGKEYKAFYNNQTKVEYEDHKKNPNINSLKVGQEVELKVKNNIIVEIEIED